MHHSDFPKQLWLVGDVAQWLGVSKRTVYRLVEEGKMPAPLKIGRCVRWKPETIVAFFGNRNVSPSV